MMNLRSQLSQFFTGKATGSATNDYQRISALEARNLLSADASAKIVDVRTEGEYRGQHIAGSILVPLTAITEKAPVLLPNKQAAIIVHCQSGQRSRHAAHQLLGMGYTQVYD
ncbi:MAG TPA: rhodanese-like domain-containing protein, partial [Armatimonadota bacterium]